MIVVRPAVNPLHNVNQVGFRTGVEGAGGLGHGCNASSNDESIVISDSIARNPILTTARTFCPGRGTCCRFPGIAGRLLRVKTEQTS